MLVTLLKILTLKFSTILQMILPAGQVANAAHSASGAPNNVPGSINCGTSAANTARHEAPFHVKMPLRVRHIVEAGQQHCSDGRLIISGRMADVCAELDRLAACEAAMS